jgi:hypothetical protein
VRACFVGFRGAGVPPVVFAKLLQSETNGKIAGETPAPRKPAHI